MQLRFAIAIRRSTAVANVFLRFGASLFSSSNAVFLLSRDLELGPLRRATFSLLIYVGADGFGEKYHKDRVDKESMAVNFKKKEV